MIALFPHMLRAEAHGTPIVSTPAIGAAKLRQRALFHGTCLPLIQGEAELLAQAAGSPGDPLAPTAPRPPWSFYETIGWGMIAFIATSVAEPIVVASLIAWQEWTQPGATDLHPMILEAIRRR
jgi:hypothetical protein